MAWSRKRWGKFEGEGSAFTSFSETNCLGSSFSSSSLPPSLLCRRRWPLWIGGLIQMKLGPNPIFVRSSFAGSSFMLSSSYSSLGFLGGCEGVASWQPPTYFISWWGSSPLSNVYEVSIPKNLCTKMMRCIWHSPLCGCHIWKPLCGGWLDDLRDGMQICADQSAPSKPIQTPHPPRPVASASFLSHRSVCLTLTLSSTYFVDFNKMQVRPPGVMMGHPVVRSRDPRNVRVVDRCQVLLQPAKVEEVVWCGGGGGSASSPWLPSSSVLPSASVRPSDRHSAPPRAAASTSAPRVKGKGRE